MYNPGQGQRAGPVWPQGGQGVRGKPPSPANPLPWLPPGPGPGRPGPGPAWLKSHVLNSVKTALNTSVKTTVKTSVKTTVKKP